MIQLLRATLGLCVLVGLASCASVPARLEVSDSAPTDPIHTEASLVRFLEEALDDVHSREGNEGLARFVQCWALDWDEGDTGVLHAKEPGLRYEVTFRTDRPGSFSPSYFGVLSPARDHEVLKMERYVREGIGEPLVAIRENEGTEAMEKWYPPEAVTRAVTAVLHPARDRGKVREIEIELLSSKYHETVVVNGVKEPLAADFTAPWAALLSRAKKLARSRFRDPIFRRDAQNDPQLYLMEPYDPRKEVVIMIHGLFDTPLIWADISNNLWAHEDLRPRYQVWHFLYDTSAPALYSGRMLRTQLAELRSLLDPDGDDPATQSTTLITHSMGGIVARGLISEPGDAFWEAGFTVPPDELVLTPNDRTMLEDAFEWQADPSVQRVIFIAVPHRGSDLADNLVGKLGRLLVQPPQDFQEFYRRISTTNPDVFTEDYRKLGEGKLDSVHSLSPEQPTLKILADLPVPHVKGIHSIIGDQGKEGPQEDSTDGIVPYWSSHLPDADSELVVPWGHGAYQHDYAREEIERILLLE